MSEKTQHTPGPYSWRKYAMEPAEVEEARKLGISPVRMLTNYGQVTLMAGVGYEQKRVALVDCQTNFKRGRGYKTECAERDATATLLSAAPDLVEPWLAADSKDWERLFEMLPNSGHGQFWRDILESHRAALSKATGQ